MCTPISAAALPTGLDCKEQWKAGMVTDSLCWHMSKSFGWSQLEVNPNDSCKLLSSLQQKIHIGCFETFVIVAGQPIAWFPNQSLVLWLFFKTEHGTRNTGFLRYDYFKCSPALSRSPTWGHLGWIQMVHLAIVFALVRIISSTPAFASPLVWAV